MSENPAENVRPRRRWLQYSLRSLLVLTVVVAGGASWLAVRIKEAREQKRALEKIKQVDGNVEYGDGGWLARILGDDLVPVVKVSFRYHPVDDSDLRHMKSLARLESLRACEAHITDAGLQHLIRLARLRTLDLHFGDAAITDAGFRHLAHLTQLESLPLPGTIAVSDAGLQSLKGLTRLSRLHLRSSRATPKGVEDLKRALPGAKMYVDVKGASEEEMTRLALTSEEANSQKQAVGRIYKAGGEVLFGPGRRHARPFEDSDPVVEVSFILNWIADEDLQHLAGLSRLEVLEIRGAHVGDAGLQHLKTLKHLKKLELYWSDGKITDAGLRHLAVLTQMEALQLGNTQVTDEGLQSLKGLTRLKLLRVYCSRATKQGIEDLKRSLPNAEIDVQVRDGSDGERKTQASEGRREL